MSTPKERAAMTDKGGQVALAIRPVLAAAGMESTVMFSIANGDTGGCVAVIRADGKPLALGDSLRLLALARAAFEMASEELAKRAGLSPALMQATAPEGMVH